MKDESEIKYEQRQIANWKKDKNKIVLFFQRFNIDVSSIYDHILGMDYERMQVLYYLLGKIDKAVKICDFLDYLKINNNEDVDVIKIYILVSHAEITSNNLKGKGIGVELVRKFFSPVESDLKYEIIPNYLSKKIQKNINFVDILYKIRCEYTHEGNYTGIIFKKEENNVSNIFYFKYDEDKELSGKCNITYKEFLNIFMKTLIENIKIFSDYKL